MCQHDFDGKRIFQHRNEDKWDLFFGNRRVKDFWHEKECFHHLARLRHLWSGRTTVFPAIYSRRSLKHRSAAPIIEALLLSPSGEDASSEQTAINLAGLPAIVAPLRVIHTPGHTPDHQVAWDEERGIVVTGDLFLGVKVRVAHRSEAPRQLGTRHRALVAQQRQHLAAGGSGVVHSIA